MAKKSRKKSHSLRSVAANAKGWAPLQPGDIVDIVAPGSACSEQEVKGAFQFLKSWGLRPRMPKATFGSEAFVSNTDKKRFEFFKKALYASDSKAVWCLRGGYGAIRLLPEIAKLKKPRHPKLLIGYSDVTSIHNYLNQLWHWPTIHGPLLSRLGLGIASPKEEAELRDLLFGQSDKVVFSGLKPLNSKARKSQSILSTVVGGNLVVVQSYLGTPWQKSNKGAILFFEEVGERGYRIDRMLEHLAQAEYFKGVRAVVFGDMIGGVESNGRSLASLAIQRFASKANFPVLQGVPAGHGKVQRPVPFFTKAHLRLGTKPFLAIDSGANR